MDGLRVLLPLKWDGTLTGDVDFMFTAPCGMQLVHVSAICDASTSFILDVGTTADPDAYLDAVTVTGHATDPSEFDQDDFVNGQYPVIAQGDQVQVSVDYDGGAGTDAADVRMVLTFLEGGI